jgi:hypothetical protein
VATIPGSYLIYHPRRHSDVFGKTTVYFDGVSHNQDPYVWNHRLLHTACHMTQMRPQVGHINFWISGDTYPAFTHLYCDLVFEVAQRLEWVDRNQMDPKDPIVDSPAAYGDHYGWYGEHEHFKKRGKRFTLKANPERSFQPETDDGFPVDVLPLLARHGLKSDALQIRFSAGFGTRPIALDTGLAESLRSGIEGIAPIRLTGAELQVIRAANPDKLAGQLPKK